MMKNVFIIVLVVLGISELQAQSYNQNKTSLTRFLIRMYTDTPFEGVRIVNDYDSAYLISVLSLDKTQYKTESALNRVASLKATSQVSNYLNGSKIIQNTIIHTSEKSNKETSVEIVEHIQEYTTGHVKALEHLTNFTNKEGRQVFIFIKEIKKVGK